MFISCIRCDVVYIVIGCVALFCVLLYPPGVELLCCLTTAGRLLFFLFVVEYVSAINCTAQSMYIHTFVLFCFLSNCTA